LDDREDEWGTEFQWLQQRGDAGYLAREHVFGVGMGESGDDGAARIRENR
jgi:hypothetical protein